jgi:uncharacterized protein (DUF952 family)
VIFHITTQAEADAALAAGEYEPRGFGEEGFIHCAHGHQVSGVLDRYFRGRTGLVMLTIDPSRLACPVVEENLAGGAELFPHVYGRLPVSAIVAITPLPFTDTSTRTM